LTETSGEPPDSKSQFSLISKKKDSKCRKLPNYEHIHERTEKRHKQIENQQSGPTKKIMASQTA